MSKSNTQVEAPIGAGNEAHLILRTAVHNRTPPAARRVGEHENKVRKNLEEKNKR